MIATRSTDEYVLRTITDHPGSSAPAISRLCGSRLRVIQYTVRKLAAKGLIQVGELHNDGKRGRPCPTYSVSAFGRRYLQELDRHYAALKALEAEKGQNDDEQ